MPKTSNEMLVPSDLLIAECAVHLRADRGIEFGLKMLECIAISLDELREDPVDDLPEENAIDGLLVEANTYIRRSRICMRGAIDIASKHTETHTDGSKEKRNDL